MTPRSYWPSATWIGMSSSENTRTATRGRPSTLKRYARDPSPYPAGANPTAASRSASGARRSPRGSATRTAPGAHGAPSASPMSTSTSAPKPEADTGRPPMVSASPS